MRRSASWSTLVAATALAAGLASAATVAPPANLGELGRASDAVVLARAGAGWSEAGPLIPHTVTPFSVIDQIAGEGLSRSLLVVAPGGEVDGAAAIVPGVPRFEPGGVYLLFLDRHPDGRWRLKTLAYGVLTRVAGDHGALLQPVEQAAEVSLLAAGPFEPVESYREQALLEHLREVVADGRGWRADLVRAPGPRDDTGGSKTTEAPADCTFMEYSEDGHGVRWFDFDDREHATIAATTPGQSGIEDGGAGAIDHATAAWTDDPGSDILLDYGGVIEQNIVCTPDDDSDFQTGAVVFDDPCDDIARLVNCSGTLAFGGPRFYVSTREFDGAPWHPAFDLFVIVNDGTECIGETNFEEVMTHEIGHGVGLGHYGTRANSTMYAQCCRGWGATLGPADEVCTAYLYPAAGPQPPLAPSGLTATPASATEVDLAWIDNADDEDAFAVLRDLGGGFAEIATLPPDTTSYRDASVGPCTTASYTVVARNAEGDSDPSDAASATTGGNAPQLPTALSASVVGASRVDLTWSNGAAPQSSIRVFRAVDEAAFELLATLGGEATSYSDTTVTSGHRYAYRVQGVSNCGTSAYSASVTVGVGEPAEPLVLGNGRFAVEAFWRTAAGDSGAGTPVALSDDTGYFWFFKNTNVELLVKVLDGCAVNGNFWVFAGGLTDVEVELRVTDTATSSVTRYTNPQQTPFAPIQDTAAFATCDSVAQGTIVSRPRSTAAAVRTDLSGDCTPGPTTLCLNDGRFKVEVAWETADAASGAGSAVPLTADTGTFWFFRPGNVEMVVKVLDGCSVNGNYWVFAGGLTDVEVTMTVTDTGETHEPVVYVNPLRTPFAPIQDTAAFATCP